MAKKRPSPSESQESLELQQPQPSTVLECDSCSENNSISKASYSCPDCQKSICVNCSRYHKIFLPTHKLKNLDGTEKQEEIENIMSDVCRLHEKGKDCYCNQCDKCFCDTCYKDHLTDSPECPLKPLSIEEEVLKQRSKGPSLAKEMGDLKESSKNTIVKINSFIKDLQSDRDLRCEHAWEYYNEMVENARRKTIDLCDEIKQQTADQVNIWKHLLEENEEILTELEAWLLKLDHLLDGSSRDVNVVRDLRSLESKLSSWKDKQHEHVGSCQLLVTYPDWWLQTLKLLKNETIGSVTMTVSKNFKFDHQYNLDGSNKDVTSIQVSEKDGHIFVSDYKRKSVSEYTDLCELVYECELIDKMNKFSPYDVCILSQDVSVVVVCGQDKRIVFLERMKKNPFLKIQKIIPTNREFLSVCEVKGSILVCDHFFHIDSFSKEGEKIKTIASKQWNGVFWPRIRADPSTRNFWATKLGSMQLECYDSNGEKIRSVMTEEKIIDFCVGGFGHFYFCNHGGLYSFSPKSILKRFENKSEHNPVISSLKNRIFVCLGTCGEYSVEMYIESKSVNIENEIDLDR